MQAKRTKALTDLSLLVEELRYSVIVLSDTKLLEELEQICFWASYEGNRSSLPEITKRIDDTKLKVRDLLHLLCISIHIISTIFFIFFKKTQIRTDLLHSLQTVIIENAPILNSYGDWMNRAVHIASLRAIADKLLDARAEVRELNIRGLEMPECGVVLLSESICRVLNWSNLWPQN